MIAHHDISVAIPTYGRGQVLIDTIAQVLDLARQPGEILVMDQNPAHQPAVETRLAAWHNKGRIRWFRLAEPSIPKAMNRALLEARHPVVLFLDDDVELPCEIVALHAAAQMRSNGLVAGQVIQPWNSPLPPQAPAWPAGREDDPDSFFFNSGQERMIERFMGGNFSIDRHLATGLGGFDENFLYVAYRFEAEFAHRWLASGRGILFAPEATINHLKASGGGTRSFGDHLRTTRPAHSVGAHYYNLRTMPGPRAMRASLRRLLGAARTRYHLRRPWRIPLTLMAECRGLCRALALHAAGPALIAPPRETQS